MPFISVHMPALLASYWHTITPFNYRYSDSL